MSQTCKIRITVRDMSKEKIKAVYESLEPDNVDFPKGLSMSMKQESDVLFLDFKGTDKAVASLAPTIDEVLGHVQTVLGVAGLVKSKQFEHETISLYAFWAGIHASISYVLAETLPMSPVQSNMTL